MLYYVALKVGRGVLHSGQIFLDGPPEENQKVLIGLGHWVLLDRVEKRPDGVTILHAERTSAEPDQLPKDGWQERPQYLERQAA